MKETTNDERELFSYLGLIIWLASIASLFLVAHWFETVTIILLLNLVYCYLTHKKAQKSTKVVNNIRYLFSIATIIISIAWMITKNYSLLITLQTISSCLGLVEGINHLIQTKGVWKSKKIKYVLWILIILIATYGSVYLIQIAINPNEYIISLRLNGEKNSYDAPQKETVLWNDTYYLTNDIKYSETYPNSYFDIYHASDDVNEKKPVFVYLHGGGWVFGDKNAGDPTASDNAGYYVMIKRMIDEGYTVISVNYALAPEYPYPTPIYQMVDLIKFLKEQGQNYGLDANHLVLAGGSAGAQTVGQFAATQTNPEYAKEMGIEQVVTTDEIKAIYLGCGLLNPTRVSDSNLFIVDHMLYQLVRGYFHAGALEDNEQAHQANIINQVTENYPPVYITDGNVMTYHKQAHELDDKLTELGVKHEAFIYDSEEYSDIFIPHSYDLLDDEYSSKNLDQWIEFLDRVIQ